MEQERCERCDDDIDEREYRGWWQDGFCRRCRRVVRLKNTKAGGNRERARDAGIWALVLALVGWMGLGPLCWIPAVILAAPHRRRDSAAKIGWVLSMIGLILTALLGLLFLFAILSGAAMIGGR